MFECVDNIRVCNKFIIPIYSIICKKEKQLYFVFLIQYELFIDSVIGCGSDDGMELQDHQRALPRPVVDYGQSIAELEKGFTGLYKY